MPEEREELDRAEWRSGRFHTFDKSGEEEKPWHVERSSILTKKLDWPISTLDRIRRLVLKIQSEFGVRLPQGTVDDCPWLLHIDSMPAPWGWDMCMDLMTEVYWRLKEHCNGLDPTEDDPECVFIEIIFIACIWIWTDKGSDKDTETGKFWDYDQKLALSKDYAEFLGLPVVLAIKNPLCFAVGHKLHSHTMRSGWRKAPTKLSHRNNERQNMLLETQTSNYAKHNFETKDYPAIKNLLRENRQSSLGPAVADFQRTGVFW